MSPEGRAWKPFIPCFGSMINLLMFFLFRMQQVFHIFVKYLAEKLAVYSSHPLFFCNNFRKIFYKYLISDQLVL